MSNGIVLIVESIPKKAGDCPFSEWKPYPPIIKEPGYYKCSLGGVCELEDDCCSHMKPLEKLN